jgi:hypothetical protein
MLQIIFTCDYCEHQSIYPGLRNGHALPEFLDREMCLDCKDKSIKLLKESMKVSNCCQAPFINGYIEDGERCSACKEHCGEE